MCGIVVYISGHNNGFSHNEMSAFSDMLFMDTLRGKDSTGVFGVDKHNGVVVHKEASAAPAFMETTEWSEFKKDMIFNGKIVVGHNRAATRGSVSDENAHPFVVDKNIILVQNGTYKGSHKHLKDVEVDTEAIAHVISENGDVETALKKINAAYALVWYNVKEQTLHIIRNSERPLYVAYTKNGGVIFASEWGMILAACSRNNIELKDKPYLLKEHSLAAYVLQKNGDVNESHKEINAKYEYPVVQYTTFTQQQHSRYDVHNINHHKTMGPNAITVIFQEYILHKRPELTTEIGKMHSVVQACDEVKRDNNNEAWIEVYDYIPANGSKTCSAWFVYGTIFLADSPVDKVLCYWIVDNKTEEEVIEYVTTQMFEGSLRSVNGRTGNNKAVITCFVSDPKPVVPETTASAVINLVH